MNPQGPGDYGNEEAILNGHMTLNVALKTSLSAEGKGKNSPLQSHPGRGLTVYI